MEGLNFLEFDNGSSGGSNNSSRRNSGEKKLLKCLQHQRELEFLCKDCNVLVCANCVISSEHRGHVVDDYQSLISSNLKEDSNNSYTKRLNEIWEELKAYAERIQFYQENEKMISDYYRNIHEFLRLEEYKLTKPYMNERERIEKLMEINIKEVKSIHQILHYKNQQQQQQSTVDLNNNNNNFNNMEQQQYFIDNNSNTLNINSIIESIDLCKNINEFLDIYKDTDLLNDGYQHSLLCQMQYITANFSKKDHDQPIAGPPLYTISFNDKVFKEIKILLHQLYQIDNRFSIPQLVTPKSNQTRIFTIGGNGAFSFDPLTSKWSKLEVDREKRKYTQCSVVSARDHVYIFGGSKRSITYSRLSTTSLKWDHCGPIGGNGEGGFGISVCYDGHKYIYLVGGQFNGINMTRVDRLDLDTLEFKRIGELLQPRYYSFSFVKAGHLYVVGGYNDFKSCQSIIQFDLEDGNCAYHMDGIPFQEWIISECFDSEDTIYIYDSEGNFFSISITNKSRQVLNPPKVSKKFHYRHSMVFNDTNNSIFLFGGSRHGNYQYSIVNNEWTRIHDKDDIDRRYHGSAFIT